MHLRSRAGLERFGLVHEHKNTKQIYVSCSWAEVTKKSRAAAVGGGAHQHGRDAWRLRGGRRSRCSCVVDPHHDRRGEHRSSFPSFPLTFPTICPNVNRQPPLWAKVGNTDSGGGAIPMFPRLPRVLRPQKHGPLTLPAPLVGMPSSHVAISDVRSCVPGAPFVAVLRVLASPSATPKCLSGTSTWGTAAATRSHDFQVRNSFPECNTPLISAHGALSSTPCC